MTVSRALLLLLLAALLSCTEEEPPGAPPGASLPPAPEEAPPPPRVRPGILGDRGWYPADPEELARKVDGLLAAAPEWEGPAPIALVAPHAGYDFAGREQGNVYRTIQGRSYRRVFLLGVNHRAPVRGISIPDFTHYETPLGRVPLDRAAMDRLLALGPPFRDVTAAHREEHSLEIHLPFLQRTLGDFHLVPMIVSLSPGGGRSPADFVREVERAAELLREEIGPGDLVIASSDNTHYGANFDYWPFPPDGEVAANLRRLDLGAAERVLALDLPGFVDYRSETGITICGFRPICLLLALLPPGVESTFTGYDTSGRVTGSYRSSVSYVGVAFHGATWGAEAKPFPPLSREEREVCLGLARASLERFVEKREVLLPLTEGFEIPAVLRRKAGTFVTLRIGGDLRGCIGDVLPRRSLYFAIVSRTISSACEDRRFRPVTPEELDRIRIEVSVLTPPRPVESAEEIEIGKHGILLSYDGRFRSVYLPQVAPEQGWDLEETLANLSRKGGLPADAWRSPRASFQVFTAQVFAEDE